MLYEIDNKYYVKVGKYFVEVTLVYGENDVDLKPTKNKLENNGNIKYEEFDFLSNKSKLLESHKKAKTDSSERKEDSKMTNRRY